MKGVQVLMAACLHMLGFLEILYLMNRTKESMKACIL